MIKIVDKGAAGLAVATIATGVTSIVSFMMVKKLKRENKILKEEKKIAEDLANKYRVGRDMRECTLKSELMSLRKEVEKLVEKI